MEKAIAKIEVDGKNVLSIDEKSSFLVAFVVTEEQTCVTLNCSGNQLLYALHRIIYEASKKVASNEIEGLRAVQNAVEISIQTRLEEIFEKA